jgi:ribosomal protein S18 acetylase RimI-like enzyme
MQDFRNPGGDPNRGSAAGHPLDRVIWHALTGVQQDWAQGDGRVRRYLAAVAPFAAIEDTEPASWRSLLPLIGAEEPVALLNPEAPRVPADFSVVRRDLVEQMVMEGAGATSTAAIEPLGAGDVGEMLALTAATQPGPFAARTIELGRYLGIRRNGALAAMAGERIRLDGFTEVSAVCVHPDHRGQGYAAELILALTASIAARSETPILHVFSSNAPAIALYRKLGFTSRRQLHLTVLGQAADASGRRSSRNS